MGFEIDETEVKFPCASRSYTGTSDELVVYESGVYLNPNQYEMSPRMVIAAQSDRDCITVHFTPEDALTLAIKLMDWARDHIEVTVSGPGWELDDEDGNQFDPDRDDIDTTRYCYICGSELGFDGVCPEAAEMDIDEDDYFFGEGPDGAGREEWR